MKLANAFSLSILARFPAHVYVSELSTGATREMLGELGIESFIGHADTAAMLSRELEMPVAANRANLVLEPGNQMIVAQYVGPRLPEGTVALPEGARIKWYCVTFGNRNF
jgi:hypothetical protein